MPLSRHTFAACDTDSDDSVRSAAAFVAGLNLHLEAGDVYPATGNVAVPYGLPPTGTTRALGAFPDGATGAAIELLYHDGGQHRLVRYDPTGNAGAGSRTTLLEWAGLAFALDLVPNGGILDGILIYRDANGELRAVNLARAAGGGYSAAYLAKEPFALHLVKVPPSQVLTAVRSLESGLSSREGLRIMQGKAYQFSYRYRYVDGEQTPFAPYSSWLDVLTDPAAVTFNTITLTLPAGIPSGVLEVELLAREAAAGDWQVVDTLRRAGGVLPTTYRFYGQLLGGGVTPAEAAKLSEALWPCDAATIGRSRVLAAGFREGYLTPEPAFTAVVQVGNTDSEPGALYTVDAETNEPGEPSQNGEPVPDVSVTHKSYYSLASGAYPDAGSFYHPVAVSVKGAVTSYSILPNTTLSYAEAFTDPLPGEYYREVSISQAAFTAATALADLATFHERSSYRVVAQFYDALGRPYGCSQPRTVTIPKQTPASPVFRSVRVTLTTTDAAALNAEIPLGAASYQFLVARCDDTLEFRQGRAADVLGYLGHKTVINDTNGDVDQVEQVVDAIHVAHQKLLVDIGNWPATGQGYVWKPGSGDVLRFLNEDKEFVITDQRGDYLEIPWTGYPDKSTDAQGRTQARIEIYSPNTSPSALYYERGPRLPVTRTGSGASEQRGYSQASVLLEGDCFLVPLFFPIIDRTDPDAADGTYVPPNKKQYTAAAAAIYVESMVPPFRLAPSSSTTVVVHERQQKGVFDGFFGIRNQESVNVSTSTENTAQTVSRTAANLLWLDMSYGGRPGFVIPPQLQQVYRPNLLRFSGVKQVGNLINGLSQWDALNQYDKLPQEQGGVTGLVLADQTQTDGTVLLATQRRGTVSLYLGQQPIQTDPTRQLLAVTDQVIGGENSLKGGFGCSDPASIVAYAGKVFWWCREREELIRYHNGLVPLGETYKFRRRLQAAARQYGSAPVRGCFDPRRQEYVLTFDPTGDLPGLTLVWSERRSAWADALSAHPEAGQGLGNELLSWQGGALYRHTPTAPVGTFYGVYTAPWVRVTTASPDEAAKRWMSLEVRTEGGLWNAGEAGSITTDTGQASRTRPEWWTQREGVWRLREGLRRNELTPGYPSSWVALDRGHPLVSPRLTLTFTCPADNPQPLSMAIVSWQPRAGQTMGV